MSIKALNQILIDTALIVAALYSTNEAQSQTFDPNNPTASGYTLVFGDKFNLSNLDPAKWSTGWAWSNGSGINATYPNDEALSGNITFRNGVAHFAVKKQLTPSGKPYSAAVATTSGKFAQAYGYWEASIRTPKKAHGLWPAFWLVPTDYSWPPEIDILEWLGTKSNTLFMTLHYGPNDSRAQGVYQGPDFSAAFHRVGVLWTPKSLTWYIDGTERASTTVGIPSEPMYVILSNDTGGWDNNVVDSTTVFPAIFSVDYVAVYAPPVPDSKMTYRRSALMWRGFCVGQTC
jgi:beta-glucanase (GH16 family)